MTSNGCDQKLLLFPSHLKSYLGSGEEASTIEVVGGNVLEQLPVMQVKLAMIVGTSSSIFKFILVLLKKKK